MYLMGIFSRKLIFCLPWRSSDLEQSRAAHHSCVASVVVVVYYYYCYSAFTAVFANHGDSMTLAMCCGDGARLDNLPSLSADCSLEGGATATGWSSRPACEWSPWLAKSQQKRRISIRATSYTAEALSTHAIHMSAVPHRTCCQTFRRSALCPPPQSASPVHRTSPSPLPLR